MLVLVLMHFVALCAAVKYIKHDASFLVLFQPIGVATGSGAAGESS